MQDLAPVQTGHVVHIHVAIIAAPAIQGGAVHVLALHTIPEPVVPVLNRVVQVFMHAIEPTHVVQLALQPPHHLVEAEGETRRHHHHPQHHHLVQRVHGLRVLVARGHVRLVKDNLQERLALRVVLIVLPVLLMPLVPLHLHLLRTVTRLLG